MFRNHSYKPTLLFQPAFPSIVNTNFVNPMYSFTPAHDPSDPWHGHPDPHTAGGLLQFGGPEKKEPVGGEAQNLVPIGFVGFRPGTPSAGTEEERDEAADQLPWGHRAGGVRRMARGAAR